ncbi:MAG: sulfotransferase [Maritimibacter sp.]
MSVDSILRKADKQLKRGEYGDAAQLYLEVLTQFPGNKRAQSGITKLEKAVAQAAEAAVRAQPAADTTPPPAELIHTLRDKLDSGAFEQVIDEGTQLVSRYPNAPALPHLIGLAYGRSGRHEQAIQQFDRACTLAPDFIDAHVNRTASLAFLGRHEEAIEAARKTIRRAPQNAAPYLHLAYSTAQLGRWQDSLTACQKVLDFDPNNVQALIGAGHAELMLAFHEEAEVYFRKAHDIAPNDIKIVQNIATTLNAQGRAMETIDFLTPLLDRFPQDTEIRLRLADANLTLNWVSEARDIGEDVVSKEADNAQAWSLLANCYNLLGDKEQSVRCFKSALNCEPDSILALSKLLKATLPSEDDPDLARLQSYFDEADFSSNEYHIVGFALFNIYHKNGETAKAFDCLEKANASLSAYHPYNMDRQQELFEIIKQQFSPLPARLNSDILEELPMPQRPVFIVGMPRSGTSLVEQILASHSHVYGAGELQNLGNVMQDLGWRRQEQGQGPAQQALRTIRAAYIDGISKLNCAAPVITDKTPLNFSWLGHALLAMPEARVLFMRRDSRATCWSNYSRCFVGRANDFGNGMDAVTQMYHAHLDLMSFWMQLFPDRIRMVPYEHLTEDQEAESRKLIEFIGLDWEEACLDFHKTKRAIRTASSDQVKQKMYTGSSEAWRRYEQYLGPMLEGLEGLD